MLGERQVYHDEDDDEAPSNYELMKREFEKTTFKVLEPKAFFMDYLQNYECWHKKSRNQVKESYSELRYFNEKTYKRESFIKRWLDDENKLVHLTLDLEKYPMYPSL